MFIFDSKPVRLLIKPSAKHNNTQGPVVFNLCIMNKYEGGIDFPINTKGVKTQH